ncbi:integral membrane sensor domain MASE1 [Silvimonas terrae]|uniref:Integral membrane sensor domain MASE1 n=1 Tax=Silvimonas terrae TaxID=300266 RepID=A0A840RA65_9NEIS|nr:MASE1 domain-containing protein [Silvimonas terrae]MBB5189346.1 integral membrane sensor domain MASE1 [Silvimonas terrae]
MSFPPLSRIWTFVLVFGALVLFSMLVRDPVTHSTLIWPAGGVLLGTLMLAPRREWLVYCVVAGWLHFGAGLFIHRPVAVSALYVLFNLGTMLSIAALWRWRKPGRTMLTEPVALCWFVGLVLAGSLLGALAGSEGLKVLGFAPLKAGVDVLAISTAVGALVGAPLVLAWAGFGARRSAGRQSATGAVWFALLLVSAAVAFDNGTIEALFGAGTFELSYLPLVFMVLVALSWQQRGMAAALLALSVIACVNTAQGDGPFAHAGNLLGDPLLQVQVYLAVAALLGLLMSAINAAREAALADALAWKVRADGMLLGTQQLMYEVDPATGNIIWAGPMPALMGLTAPQLPHLDDFFARIHPQDRSRVTDYAALREAGGVAAFTQTFRFKTGNGQWVTLEDTGAPVVDFDDSIYRVSGLLRLAATANQGVY